MNAQWDVLSGRVLLLLLLPLVVVRCSSGNDKATARQLNFDVVDSLLGPVYEVKSAGKSFHPPIGFVPIPDSLFAILREKFTQEVGPEGTVDFIQFFFDQRHSAGLIVSTIRGLSLSGDTATFVENYRQSLVDIYGEDHVTAGDYWVDSIYVKNFLVTDSLHVRFQLLCLSLEGDALELQYVAPRAVYPGMIKLLESSIGTLKPMQQGG